jgi:molecular chaperone GrpE
VSDPRRSEEEEVLDLDAEDRSDVAKALADAERVVAVVEERQKRLAGDVPEAVEAEQPAPGAEELARLLAAEKENVARAAEETARYRDALLLKSADFENLKRRTEREKSEYFRFALADIFTDLLAVLDNFERALQNVAGVKLDDFHAGIEMIARQLAETLKKNGLTETPAVGLPFDPNVHEAVMREETSDALPGTVIEVLQKGYTLNDRMLRPAKVKVAAAPALPGGHA